MSIKLTHAVKAAIAADKQRTAVRLKEVKELMNQPRITKSARLKK
jgi:hypothetical protein